MRNARERLPNIDRPLESDWGNGGSGRIESVLGTCWNKHDDNTPADIRVVQGHCSRPIANSSSKIVIKIPHGWSNVFCHQSSQQHIYKILLNGLIAGGIGRKEAGKHVTTRPRILSKAKQLLIKKVGNHRSFFTVITSGVPTRFMKLIWSKHKIYV